MTQKRRLGQEHRTSVRIPIPLLRRMDGACGVLAITRTELVLTAVEEWLDATAPAKYAPSGLDEFAPYDYE